MINNLASLKKDCDLYEWEAVANSYTNKFIGVKRRIEKKQSNSIKFDNGSWLEFPKAKDLIIDGDLITIKNDFDGVLTYRLTKIEVQS